MTKRFSSLVTIEDVSRTMVESITAKLNSKEKNNLKKKVDHFKVLYCFYITFQLSKLFSLCLKYYSGMILKNPIGMNN